MANLQFAVQGFSSCASSCQWLCGLNEASTCYEYFTHYPCSFLLNHVTLYFPRVNRKQQRLRVVGWFLSFYDANVSVGEKGKQGVHAWLVVLALDTLSSLPFAKIKINKPEGPSQSCPKNMILPLAVTPWLEYCKKFWNRAKSCYMSNIVIALWAC